MSCNVKGYIKFFCGDLCVSAAELLQREIDLRIDLGIAPRAVRFLMLKAVVFGQIRKVREDMPSLMNLELFSQIKKRIFKIF